MGEVPPEPGGKDLLISEEKIPDKQTPRPHLLQTQRFSKAAPPLPPPARRLRVPTRDLHLHARTPPSHTKQQIKVVLCPCSSVLARLIFRANQQP